MSRFLAAFSLLYANFPRFLGIIGIGTYSQDPRNPDINMDIEVQQKEGYFVEATIVSLDSKGLTVHYRNDWKDDETVSYSQCRVVNLPSAAKQPFKAGDVIEALIKRTSEPQIPVWQKVKVRDIKVSILFMIFLAFRKTELV